MKKITPIYDGSGCNSTGNSEANIMNAKPIIISKIIFGAVGPFLKKKFGLFILMKFSIFKMPFMRINISIF